jgi:uncharacterized protein (TIGR02328 family)
MTAITGGRGMRLWHEDLITKLPRQQLLGQHRECCALRGLGWGKKHATVNYVFNYSPIKLYQYHILIMHEMLRRGYKHDKLWQLINYRGKQIGIDNSWNFILFDQTFNNPVYPEHNNKYLEECLLNLQKKGINLR